MRRDRTDCIVGIEQDGRHSTAVQRGNLRDVLRGVGLVNEVGMEAVSAVLTSRPRSAFRSLRRLMSSL